MEHDFRESLAFSHAASDLPFWKHVYETFFVDFVAMHDERDNGWWQSAGIDRTIVCRGSRVVRVDEKVRGFNKLAQRTYPDIALEFISNDRTDAPGWVCKPLACDYIAYAIAPFGWCYMLPIVPLQAAWRQHGERWKSQYAPRQAKNKGYSTHFVGVPVDVLFAAMGNHHRISFEPLLIEDGTCASIAGPKNIYATSGRGVSGKAYGERVT